jgi:hypothetical protein
MQRSAHTEVGGNATCLRGCLGRRRMIIAPPGARPQEDTGVEPIEGAANIVLAPTSC